MKPVAASARARYNYDNIFTKPGPLQGMTEEQFQLVSLRLRERLRQEAGRIGDLGDDLFVHGSRGRGTAEPDADLDIGIRVSADRFEQMLLERLTRVKPGGDRWDTLQRARERGRLHQGEVGISGISRELSGSPGAAEV